MTNWHKCKEELPTKDGQYLVIELFAGHKSINILNFTLNAYKVDNYDFEQYKRKKAAIFYGYDSEYGHYEVNDVTHWTELPDMPEEEEE